MFSLAKESNLERLLTYALAPVSKDDCSLEVDEMTLKDKFPYVAGEILRSTIGRRLLMSKITRSSSLLQRMFSILNEESPNCFYGKQFVRIITSFVKNDLVKEFMYNYIFKNEAEVFRKFVQKIHLIPTIDNLIVTCLNYETSDFDQNENDFNEGKEIVIGLIIENFKNLRQTEFLSKMVISLLQCERPNKSVTLFFQNISKFLSNVISIYGDGQYEFSEACHVIIDILKHPPKENDEPIKHLLKAIPDFLALLELDLGLPKVQSTWGHKEALGLGGLGVISFLELIITKEEEFCSIKTFKEDMIKCGLFKQLVTLMFKFNHHQIAYSHITNIIIYCFQKKIDVYINHLLEDCKLSKHVQESFDESISNLVKSKSDLNVHGLIANIPFLFELGFYFDDFKGKKREKFFSAKSWGNTYDLFTTELKRVHFFECVFRCGGDLTIPTKFKKGTLLTAKRVKQFLEGGQGNDDVAEEEEEEEGEDNDEEEDGKKKKKKKEEEDNEDNEDTVEGFWDSEDIQKREKVNDFSYFFD